MTVGQPRTIFPPWAVMSPMRAAGCPPMRTVKLPSAMVSGGPTQYTISPTRAAGRPPISTVRAPGAVIGPPTCRHDAGHHRTDMHIGDAGGRRHHSARCPLSAVATIGDVDRLAKKALQLLLAPAPAGAMTADKLTAPRPRRRSNAPPAAPQARLAAPCCRRSRTRQPPPRPQDDRIWSLARGPLRCGASPHSAYRPTLPLPLPRITAPGGVCASTSVRAARHAHHTASRFGSAWAITPTASVISSAVSNAERNSATLRLRL